MAPSDNHPDPKTRQNNNIGKNWRPISLAAPNAGKAPAAQNTNTHPFPPWSTWLSAENTRHALHCQWSPSTLLPASQEKSRLIEQCSSRSIWHLHSTMWTINNCLIMSSTPTYQQQSVAGFTTICRTEEPKFIFGRKNLKAKRWKQEWYMAEFCLQRSSFSIWPTFQHRLRTSGWSSTPMTLPSTHQDLWWPNQWPQHISVASAQLHQQQKTDSNTAKSPVTLFTPDTHEHHLHPQVKLADQVLPFKKKPKVLGVTLDTHLTFTQHCNNIAVKVQQRNNVLKVLDGSTWGCDKETLLTTYQAIGRSTLSYCCPVLTPSLRDTNWSRLQRAQHSALRIAIGFHKMADVAELHQGARELPVRQHNELISQQFAIACRLPQYPCHQLSHRPQDDLPERRRSMIGRFKPNIQQYLAEPLSNTSHKSTISSIHQDVVRTAIESSSSILLNGRPPPIATAEQTLPRKTRTILAQLHTGHSRIVRQYMKIIDPTARNHWHDCGHWSHDTHYLFDCPSKPTTLTIESLWTAPTETAKHLNLSIDETS